MWNYEKRLQYPVHIKTPNAKIAQVILSQYGGPYLCTLWGIISYFNIKMIQYFLHGWQPGR